MVASHDLELAEALKDSYDNYHFRESAQEGDILFDYKLHPGISHTRNAIRLLGAMGFPEEIVSNASKYSLCPQNPCTKAKGGSPCSSPYPI